VLEDSGGLIYNLETKKKVNFVFEISQNLKKLENWKLTFLDQRQMLQKMRIAH
jgi:hypothetical protein